jgi:outer membrane protein assembly factor BamB
MKNFIVTGILILGMTALLVSQGTQSANEALWQAARDGDTAGITAALARGAEINAKSRYDVTALFFAATSGRLEAIKLLVARGADVNVQDTFYRSRAAEMALSNGHTDVTVYLLQNGADGDSLLAMGVQQNQEAIVKAAAAGKVSRQALQSALTVAGTTKRDALILPIKEALDKLPPEPAPAFTVNPAVLPRYAGNYRDATSGAAGTVSVQNGELMLQMQGGPLVRLVPTAENVFRVVEVNATLTFNERAGIFESIGLVQGPANLTLTRLTGDAPAVPPPPAAAPAAAATPAAPIVRRTGARNWPSFRGDGSGDGDGQRAIAEWDTATGKNIKWKTPIPGVANSSPIVWSNRVFATTAVSSAGNNSFRTGLYGDVAPVEDLSPHEWKIYCLDKATGKILWERVAVRGVPRTKRHTKGSQASSTPVTDGRRVIAVFGSAGAMIAWDYSGKELWRVNLGTLDSGWFLDPAFQWGHSSSPIIYRNSVIVQADVQKGSFIAAWDIATGKPLWKTERTDEIPTWGSPTIARSNDGRDVLVTNGTKIRGYDPSSGKQLWTLGPNSEVTVGTPVAGNGLVYVTGGYPPVRPIYAIRPAAEGDISLQKGQESNASIAWSNMTEGTYIPSPLLYDGYLFTLNNNGILSAYDPQTGKRAFRGRVGAGGAFSASPVGADGRLYIASEDGEVYVISATPDMKQIARNEMKEVIMATPAISDGLIIVRTMRHIYGVGQ